MPDGVGRPRRLTATGNVPGATDGGICWGGVLTPAAAISTVVIREGGSGGTVILSISAVANGQSVPVPGPFQFTGQLHVTLTGASAEVSLLV